MERHNAEELKKATDGLRELILAAEHYRHVVADDLGVGTTESQAVSYLFVRGPMGQGELGALLALNTSSMTALVDRLERSGIAERQPHPSDRRRFIIRLTASGRQRVTRTSDWLSNAFKSIPPARLAEVTASLHTITDDLRNKAMPNAASTERRRTQQ
ncbi:MarR family winged helix-turn-helix transcriptional regulator [Jatrophihabitans sp. DSM 45814]